jgi:hypothetical protein
VLDCIGPLYDSKNDATGGVVIAPEGNRSNVNGVEDMVLHKDSKVTVHDD